MELHLALVHYPVVNRRGEIVASAVTNLDLHDLARAARTFNAAACYIVTPLKDQQELAGDLIRHWCEGVGFRLHPERGNALRRLRIVESLEAAREEILARSGRYPLVWATSAREIRGALAHGLARRILKGTEGPVLMLFGTAWGLSGTVLEEADAVLEPIRGVDDYNHLSVRCAAAILLDRLLGEERVTEARGSGFGPDDRKDDGS
ncbi:MAG: RNA methyltransferase [Syntrophobacteraceae bacterium]|jgi:hypothetical protein|nr:RNA methyltransferase [Syntrophobacteraceae bacterium]